MAVVITTDLPIGTTQYFEHIHAVDPDPFGLFSRWYECRKRQVASAMLASERYRRAFEPGCSVGAFTLELARKCHEVVAMDVAQAAVNAATVNFAKANASNIEIVVGAVPDDWPTGSFDLVVLGELGYYLGPSRLRSTALQAASSLEPGGHLLAVHWRLPIDNCELGGDQVHAIVRETDRLRLLAHYEEEQFVSDLFERQPGPGLPPP
jgi:hypothetical protein